MTGIQRLVQTICYKLHLWFHNQMFDPFQALFNLMPYCTTFTLQKVLLMPFYDCSLVMNK